MNSYYQEPHDEPVYVDLCLGFANFCYSVFLAYLLRPNASSVGHSDTFSAYVTFLGACVNLAAIYLRREELSGTAADVGVTTCHFLAACVHAFTCRLSFAGRSRGRGRASDDGEGAAPLLPGSGVVRLFYDGGRSDDGVKKMPLTARERRLVNMEKDRQL